MKPKINTVYIKPCTPFEFLTFYRLQLNQTPIYKDTYSFATKNSVFVFDLQSGKWHDCGEPPCIGLHFHVYRLSIPIYTELSKLLISNLNNG